ncbi:ABC transporter ATP-binding protein [Spirochaetia bacterium 38H-sp]|uniref:ABC transporter ATP-binding protein n=1 Tax=Rarispira pelagica TaxID=3141764 RepID=A0ABU9UA35_9SPIR
MIECIELTKRYGEKTAVNSLNLMIEDGKITVLIGPSGCGKSTTIRMLNRLIEPDEGDILYNGKHIRDYQPEALRRSIGYVIQNTGLFPHWTVEENICTVPRLLGWDKEKQKKRAEEMLTLVGLKPETYSHKYPAQLSGGEAQRVGVARALAADPPVILMDEPFGATDPITRARLQTEFLEIQKKLKKTVVFVTHDMEEAISLADSIAIMESGKLIMHKKTEEILTEEENPFIRDFIGTDSSIKRLARYSIKEIAKKHTEDKNQYPVIEETATIKDALALLLKSGTEKLRIKTAEGKTAGTISLADIRELAKNNAN